MSKPYSDEDEAERQAWNANAGRNPIIRLDGTVWHGTENMKLTTNLPVDPAIMEAYNAVYHMNLPMSSTGYVFMGSETEAPSNVEQSKPTMTAGDRVERMMKSIHEVADKIRRDPRKRKVWFYPGSPEQLAEQLTKQQANLPAGMAVKGSSAGTLVGFPRDLEMTFLSGMPPSSRTDPTEIRYITRTEKAAETTPKPEKTD